MGSGPARPLAPADQVQGRFGLGAVLASVWLVYLLGTLTDALGNPNLTLRVVGVAALVAFAVLYVWAFAAIRRIRRGGRPIPGRMVLPVLGTAFVLMLVEIPAAGQSALTMGTFIIALAIFLLPTRPALIVTGALLAAAATLPHVVAGWDPDGDVFFGSAAAALAVFGVGQLLQRNVQLAAAQRELADVAVTRERDRFARDLHDLLGHSLTVVTVKAELAGRLVHADPDRAEREIGDVERLARDALADVRAAVAGYRTPTLAGELVSARAALDAAGIEADLPRAVDEVPADRRELFGWAVREGVTNVVRHSGASRCRISVTRDAVEISDDGRGAPGWGGDPQAVPDPPGNGLAGLRERAGAVGASVAVGRGDGGGFRLRVGW